MPLEFPDENWLENKVSSSEFREGFWFPVSGFWKKTFHAVGRAVPAQASQRQ
jgi:hypothetical protein